MTKKLLKEKLTKVVGQIKQFLKEEKFFGYSDIVYTSHPLAHKRNIAVSQIVALAELKTQVKKCTKCDLSKYRINAVFGEGNPNTKVIFIGEGPGYDEDRQGKPFIGRAGELLAKIIESIGLNRESVYITNIVKCHPMINPQTPDRRGNDRPPNEIEILTCLPYLEKQIEIINPGVIVSLGNVACQTLLKTQEGISKVRGKVYQYKNIKLIPTYHPAALLRNPALKRDVWTDMKMLRRELQNVH